MNDIISILSIILPITAMILLALGLTNAKNETEPVTVTNMITCITWVMVNGFIVLANAILVTGGFFK